MDVKIVVVGVIVCVKFGEWFVFDGCVMVGCGVVD